MVYLKLILKLLKRRNIEEILVSWKSKQTFNFVFFYFVVSAICKSILFLEYLLQKSLNIDNCKR